MKKTLSKKLDTRFLDLIDETADGQTDQMTFSFSSETPVKRNGFNEVLDHSLTMMLTNLLGESETLGLKTIEEEQLFNGEQAI